jgi:hypothetical protein
VPESEEGSFSLSLGDKECFKRRFFVTAAHSPDLLVKEESQICRDKEPFPAMMGSYGFPLLVLPDCPKSLWDRRNRISGLIQEKLIFPRCSFLAWVLMVFVHVLPCLSGIVFYWTYERSFLAWAFFHCCTWELVY